MKNTLKCIVVLAFLFSACHQVRKGDHAGLSKEGWDLMTSDELATLRVRTMQRAEQEDGRHDVQYLLRVNLEKQVKLDKEKIEYLNFNMDRDFVLTANGGDSLAPVFCQYIDRGRPAEFDLLVAFELGAGQRSQNLVYKDRLLGVGTHVFHLPGREEVAWIKRN